MCVHAHTHGERERERENPHWQSFPQVTDDSEEREQEQKMPSSSTRFLVR